MGSTARRKPPAEPRTLLLALLPLLLAALPASAGNWDERLEGELPLPAPYTSEVAEPFSGISSIAVAVGEAALSLSDTSTTIRAGRINRGNWTDVSGLTLHIRLRALSGGDGVMGFQVNDGLASGRLAWKWYSSGELRLTTGSADPGSPNFVLPQPAGAWVEMWVRVSGGRYSVWLMNGGLWTLYSTGSTAPDGTGGAVYVGSSGTSGTGAMDLDFWRLKTTGAFAPNDPDAPCVIPASNLDVRASSTAVVSGQSVTLTIPASERGVSYQLRNSNGNVPIGTSVTGGGTIALVTGPLTSTTSFNILATSPSGAACARQLDREFAIAVAAPVSTIAQAKAFPDHTVLQLSSKPVAASAAASYWIEEPDRSSGIRVNSSGFPGVGKLVTVLGTLQTTGAERWIDRITETVGAPSAAPRAIRITSRDLGGGPLNEHTPGVSGALGVNNVGLYVKFWGVITGSGDGYYYLDDGARLSDGTVTLGQPNRGVRILGSLYGHDVGDFVTVSGAVSAFLDGNTVSQRALYPVPENCEPPSPSLPVGIKVNPVCAGQASAITVAASQLGVDYQLRNYVGNYAIGAPVAGTGGVIELPTGPLSANTAFNVLATVRLTRCSAQLSQTRTVIVSQPPDTSLAVGATADPVAPGDTSAVTVALSQTGVQYQLRVAETNVGSPSGGTGGMIVLPTGQLWETTTYNVVATSSTGCSVQLAATKTIRVNPPNSSSKIGVHVVFGPRNGFRDFLQQCSDAGHPVAVVKCVDDFGAANEAKQVNGATLTVGRVNEIDGIDLQGLDAYVGQPPAVVAAWYYSHVKPKWLQNPWIDVWETFNEWSWHYAWQADFLIALMDIAEADGFRLGLWSASVGNPPEEFYPEIARACRRARQSGGHILCLHEYGLDGLLKDASPYLVTRYRMLYAYLSLQDAVVPLVISECGENGGGGFTGPEVFVDDFAWYDTQMRQDSYVIGCAAWTLGNWDGANFQDALPALADYISTH